jgi:putative phosphoesterase
MRIAIVSDIHGNLRAFHEVLADLRQTAPDLIVHGGDLASGGTHPTEVVDEIRSLGWPGVQGNTDEMLWAPQRLADYATANPAIAPILGRIQDTIPPVVAALNEGRLQWLKSLPCQHVDENFTLVHASPGDLWRAPMPAASDDELLKTYECLNTKLVVYAHIHQPFIRRLPSLTISNTGSVSQSYDGDTRASYLLIDTESHTDLEQSKISPWPRLTVRRVPYDVESEAADLRRSGLPHADWMSRILLAGKYVAPG